MTHRARLVNRVLRFVFRLVCRIHAEELKNVPGDGPLIIVGNHINFLEAPVLIPFIDNPKMIGIEYT